jgi:NarL family two-component system response regulator LiaR
MTAAEIRTFLVADVRGYTRFTQEHGDEAAAELAAAFAEGVRTCAEARGGRLVDLRGDEALVVFGSARSAIRAAADLDSAFAEATAAEPGRPMRVGIGLDAGEAVAVEGGYRGGAINVAARLSSLAGPGEVLATETVVHLARAVEGVRYEHRDPVTVKGLDEPVAVVRIVCPACATGGRPQGIRVLVVDDHPVVRQGLRALLGTQTGIEVVGEAEDGAAAVAAADRLTPDVVLMDVVMPGMDGIEALRAIAERPETRVVMLTSYGDQRRALEAVDAGASGFLLKDASPRDVVAAIRAAHRGEAVLHPSVAAGMLAERRRPRPAHAELTARELEVLRLIARGYANKRIAAELHVSEKTVKSHVSAVLRKLDVADRTQAAMYAVRERLADPGA